MFSHFFFHPDTVTFTLHIVLLIASSKKGVQLAFSLSVLIIHMENKKKKIQEQIRSAGSYNKLTFSIN